MKQHAIAAALACAALSCGASAQQAFRPGLWQLQMRMPGDPEFESSMAELRESLASMSPQERKQMELAMGRQGVQLAPGAKGGTVTRVCMTREQAERRQAPATQGDCTVTRESRAGSTVTTAFSCRNPASTGESVLKFISAEAYAVKTTMVSGKEKTVLEGDARWLAADCGSVRPIGSQAR